jgi:hypothetical protein
MKGNSPCIKRCKLDDETCYCVSCYRTIDEIKHWSEYDNNMKEEILLHIQLRKEMISEKMEWKK